MKKLLFALLTLSLVLFVSCGAAKEESKAVEPSRSSNMNSVDSKGKDLGGYASGESLKQVENEKVIYNSELIVVVEDLDKFSKEIYSKVVEFQGFVQNQESMEYYNRMIIRIPSSKFNEFIGYAEAISKVKNKRLSSQNITDEYIDNESRLNNFKAQENQILEIFKKANTVEDILKVQNELFRIRGEIETLEGRKKLWDNQVDYATVVINAEKLQSVPNKSVGIISLNEFFKSIKNGFVNSTLWIVLGVQKLLIFIISNVIYLFILSAGLYFLYRNRNKIFKR